MMLSAFLDKTCVPQAASAVDGGQTHPKLIAKYEQHL